MYLILEYFTYIFIVTVLAAVLFGASVVALLTRESASRIARASRKTIQVATRSLERISSQVQPFRRSSRKSWITSWCSASPRRHGPRNRQPIAKR